MFFKKLAAVAAVALISTAASAQATNDGYFGEIAYTSTTFKVDGLSGDWKPSALRGTFGKGLNDNFAVEAIVLLGTTDSSNLGLNIKLSSGAGIYVKPRVQIGDLELFARLGWANINSTVANKDARDNGGSYGVGASYSFTKSVSLNADYMLYNNSNGSKIDGVSVGVGFKF